VLETYYWPLGGLSVRKIVLSAIGVANLNTGDDFHSQAQAVTLSSSGTNTPTALKADTITGIPLAEVSCWLYY
jgi:hypothetical protein